MKYVKLVTVLLFSPIPGSAYAATGSWKKTVLAVLTFFFAGLAYRLSGVGGPVVLLLGFAVYNLVWVSWIIASIAHAWKHRAKLSVVRCFIVSILAFVFMLGGLKILSPGNTVSMEENHSMQPIIDPNAFFYATKITNSYAVGDLVVYSSRGHFSAGLICGIAGDEVELRGKEIFLNGKTTDCGNERFRRAMETDSKTKIPENHVFVIKAAGLDSSELGPLAIADLRGKVLFVLDDSVSGKFVKKWIDLYGPESFLSAIY